MLTLPLKKKTKQKHYFTRFFKNMTYLIYNFEPESGSITRPN